MSNNDTPSRLYTGFEAPSVGAQTPRKDVQILEHIPSTAQLYGLTESSASDGVTAANNPTITALRQNSLSEDAASLKQPLVQFMKEIPPDDSIWATSGLAPARDHASTKSHEAISLLPGAGDALVGSVLSDFNKTFNSQERAKSPLDQNKPAVSSASSVESLSEDFMEYERLELPPENEKKFISDGTACHRFVTMQQLLQNNRRWAKAMVTVRPDFFLRLAQQQAPPVLWIGCSDSRVPANQILALEPGQVFVHRNIGNVVIHTDLNCASVLQLAVDVLKVRHVIVCGHYGCSGVWCSMQNRQYGQVDCWLRHIKDIFHQHRTQLEKVPEGPARADLLCELNVAHSVRNVCASSVIQNAWDRGQDLQVHGWCYRLTDGIIRDLKICVKSREDLPGIYRVLNTKESPEK